MAGKGRFFLNLLRLLFAYITGDYTRKTVAATFPAIIFDFLYAGFAAAVGIIYRFPWLIMMSIYYVFLTCMKCRMLYRAGRSLSRKKNKKFTEVANARSFCKWLFFMDLLLAFDVYLMTRKGVSHHYPGFLIYVMAVYVVIKVGTAIYNLFKAGRKGSFIAIAIRKLGIVEALVSVLALESALNYKYGAVYSEFDASNVLKIGIAVFVIILYMSLSGLVKTLGKKVDI
ncbi:MAG: hypothetical protein MJ108_03805 [Saccharofermentans sp.]|nr:hypothetical protein [Saccharofermentans sp.]